MIIRGHQSSKMREENNDEIVVDFERLSYIARKKTWQLTAATLLGFGLGLIYPINQFSKPVDKRLEAEIFLTGSDDVEGDNGFTGITGSTGVREIDAALSAFRPKLKLQEIAEQWPNQALLDDSLNQAGLRRLNPGQNQRLGIIPFSSRGTSTVFYVRDDSGGEFSLLADFKAPQKKPALLVLQGTLPEDKIKAVANNLLKSVNKLMNRDAQALAQLQRPFAAQALARLAMEKTESVENLPQIDKSIQIIADLSLLSNYQQIRLVENFLRKLENWPCDFGFAYIAKESWQEQWPSRWLWFLSPIFAFGFFVGGLIVMQKTDSLAGKILSQKDLSNVHPESTIFPTSLGIANLTNLLSASFAYNSREKRIAAIISQNESELSEVVFSAARRVGRTCSKNEDNQSEINVFISENPQDNLTSILTKGFGRILVTAKKGKSRKTDHQLWQNEADLAGMHITDVIFSDIEIRKEVSNHRA